MQDSAAWLVGGDFITRTVQLELCPGYAVGHTAGNCPEPLAMMLIVFSRIQAQHQRRCMAGKPQILQRRPESDDPRRQAAARKDGGFDGLAV